MRISWSSRVADALRALWEPPASGSDEATPRPNILRGGKSFVRPFRRRTRPGAVPGTVAPDPYAGRPVIHVFGYGPDRCVERYVERVDDLSEFVERFPVVWVNVDGLGDAEVVTQLGTLFGLHPLSLEDVVHSHQRAKVESYDDYLFLVARMVAVTPDLQTEQISIFLGKNFVVTFQDRPGDCLHLVRERIRSGRGQIREAGPDFLVYSLLDAVIDGYFPVVEELGYRLDQLDEQISAQEFRETLSRIHRTRSDLLVVRKSIWPHREAVNILLRDSSPHFTERTRLFLRDCYDHTVQIIEVVETYREICTDLRDFQLTAVSSRTNEIMKVLTIISTIFIPLGFIAGVYGMNFEHMPELEWEHGYEFALGLMGLVAGGLLVYFWIKGWIGRS